MLEILVPLAVAVQYLFMFVVIGGLTMLAIAGVYMVSDDFREIVHDFEMWAAHRRLKKRMRHDHAYEHTAPYEDVDPQVNMLLFEEDKQFPTIFEAVLADYETDSRALLRQKKEREAHDQETLDRASEYRRGISK